MRNIGKHLESNITHTVMVEDYEGNRSIISVRQVKPQEGLF